MELSRVTEKRKMVGMVVKDKMDKTIVVEVEKYSRHRQYKKYIRTKKRYKAHDEENRCKVGDRVVILEARPLSKDKCWVVKDILVKDTMLLQDEVRENDTGKI